MRRSEDGKEKAVSNCTEQTHVLAEGPGNAANKLAMSAKHLRCVRSVTVLRFYVCGYIREQQ
jgi:hypothetical protein